MTDRLGELLKRADAVDSASHSFPPTHPASLLPADLGQLIRDGARRRQNRRAVFAGVGVAIPVALAVVLLTLSSNQPQKILVSTRPAPGVIAAMLGSTTANRLPADPSPAITLASYAMDPVADARNDTACTMVMIARRRVRNLGPEDAVGAYQRIIELFPDTYWATVARAELAELPH
jgi:hypothetical protein